MSKSQRQHNNYQLSIINSQLRFSAPLFNLYDVKIKVFLMKKFAFLHFFAKIFGSLFFFFCFALDLCLDTIKQVFMVLNYLFLYHKSKPTALSCHCVIACNHEKVKYRLRSQPLGKSQYDKCQSNHENNNKKHI